VLHLTKKPQAVKRHRRSCQMVVFLDSQPVRKCVFGKRSLEYPYRALIFPKTVGIS